MRNQKYFGSKIRQKNEIKSDLLGLLTKVRLGSIVHHRIAVFLHLSNVLFYICWTFWSLFPRPVVGAHILTTFNLNWAT